MPQQLTSTPHPQQGELFAKALLPRQLPVFKATPEDEHLPHWAQALQDKQKAH